MENMTVGKAADICGGRLWVNAGSGVGAELDFPADKDVPARDSAVNMTVSGQIVIDSRQVQQGDIFVAYHGEKTDGHDYISAALDRGAACCLAERVPEGETRPVIVTDDVQNAVEKLAAAYRKNFELPVIGITGSVGKTTAKEMISAVLEQRFRTLKTEGNLNNRIGVPMILSRLESGYEAAVIEMGISEFGEMHRLGEIAKPNVVVMTNIGQCHLKQLKDRQGVYKAKSEVFEHLSDEATVILNGDDDILSGVEEIEGAKVIHFGVNEGNDIRGMGVAALGLKGIEA